MFEEADKTLQDLLQQRDLASHKLATLQEDGERAIAAGQRKYFIYDERYCCVTDILIDIGVIYE